MSGTASRSRIITEPLQGRSGPSGYEATVWRHRNRHHGGVAIALRGGLGDTFSVSLEPMARAIIEETDGEFIVMTTGTRRPFNVVQAIEGAANARRERAQSMLGATKHLRNRHKPQVMIMAGQSEGGVSAVDAALAWQTKSKDKRPKPVTGVMTIDSPGVYGKLDAGMPVLQGLWHLGLNCWEDVKLMSWRERAKLVGSNLLHLPSVFELGYIVGEIKYLKDIDMHTEIGDLRERGIDVWHAWHRGDIVPGADVANPYSAVFEGAHVRILKEPEPVAEYIVALAAQLEQKVPEGLVLDGYSQHNFALAG
jgi:hypothetical protein